jgi:hypothetical protein
VHPCRRVQEALRAKGIEYEKVIAAHGHPIPFLRKGSREELRAASSSKRASMCWTAIGGTSSPRRPPRTSF